MILRFKVKGFKNLRNTEVYFGPFTCIAGPNGVGKSNLFDAIRFLSALANKDNTLIEAAFLVRDEKNKKKSVLDIRNLFYHDGKKYTETIEFSIDMVVPYCGIDHLGQQAEATTTALQYNLIITLRNNSDISQSMLEIKKEELRPINKAEIKENLKFLEASDDFINSVIIGRRQNAVPFIETDSKNDLVYVRADKVQGNKKTYKISNLPRTILSTANAVENPTMLVAKREIETWKILQLEPSALRSPDDLVFSETPQISSRGEHLPATIYRLINDKSLNINVANRIANRLNELIDDVYKIHIDKDDKKDILTLIVENKLGTPIPAKSLSDGTLRFIALSVLELDPMTQGILCVEEPENGIHPARIPVIIRLLEDIACDIKEPVDSSNPLRQVIVNTHSPIVVSEVFDGSILFADYDLTAGSTSVIFRPLSGTWRTKIPKHESPVVKGRLLNYLNPYNFSDKNFRKNEKNSTRRVIDRLDIGQLSLFKI